MGMLSNVLLGLKALWNANDKFILHYMINLLYKARIKDNCQSELL